MEVVSPDDRETEEPIERSFLTQVIAGDQMSVQHSRSDPGGGAPDHSHEHEEIGYPVEGLLAITVDGEEYTVEAGEVYMIPAGEPHSLTNSGDEPPSVS